jgi:hypothetical protein
LDFREIGDLIGGSEAAEATKFLGLKPSLSRGGHRGSPSCEKMQSKQTPKNVAACEIIWSGGDMAAPISILAAVAVQLPPQHRLA